jgi:MOSC domain-containing protein YiiM
VKDLTARVEQSGFTGYYFRVLRHGHVQPGDVLGFIERPFPQWTIERCNQIMHHLEDDADSARDLAECPLLSSSWKDGLWLRVEKRPAGTSKPRTQQPG